MKSYRSLLTMGALALCAGWVMADAPPKDMKHVVERPQLIVDELSGLSVEEAALRILLALEEIEATEELTLEELLQRIAETVGCAVQALNEASPEVMRDLSPNLRENRLSVVTAAAIVASPDHSQRLMDSLLSGRIHPQEREVIQAAAAAPDRHLTRTELQSALRCTNEIRPLPVRPEPIRPLPEDPDGGGGGSVEPQTLVVPAPVYPGQ